MSSGREIRAYFAHEADARCTGEVLDVMFEQSMSLSKVPGSGRRWLLTIILPDDPALGTFYVEAPLLAMVHELVQGNGGLFGQACE
jgi:hypothetical protein